MTEDSANSSHEMPAVPVSTSAFGGSAWHLALIAIAGLAFYAFSLFVPFHGEDQRLFLDTSALQSPLTALQALDRMPYAPLTVFGYALNAWANPGDPLPLHAVNVMLHIINALLIYALLVQLLGSARSKWALGTALVFLVMVPSLYSVYYLAARPGMQASCFALFAMIAFAGASEGETLDYRRLVYAAIAYALAVGSHAAALGLPIAMLALDIARGGWPRVLRHSNMHAAFIGLMLVLERIWTTAAGASADWGNVTAYAWNSFFWLTPLPKIGLVAAVRPHHLSLEDGAGFALLILLFVRSCWRRHPSAVGWIWLLAAWLTAGIGLLPSGDMFTVQQAYFPLVGAALALPLAPSFMPNRKVGAIAGLVLAGFIAVSSYLHWQARPWNEPVAFWTEAAAYKPAMARECYRNAARYALEYGRRAEDPAERQDLLSKAEVAWNGVIANGPAQGDADDAVGLGETLMSLSRGDEALSAFQRALYADPFHAAASLNAGLLEFARMQAGAGEIAGRNALEHFRRLEQLGPLPNEAWAPYVLVLANAGEFARALEKATGIPAGAPPVPEAAIKEIEKAAKQVEALRQQEDHLKTPDQWKEASLIRAQRFAIEGRLTSAFYLLEQLQAKAPDPRADALLARVKEQMAKRAAPAAP